tara:strand:- start:2198 stop:2374 length:177 start_codon:yes stop_codon:yes gene_type:complete
LSKNKSITLSDHFADFIEEQEKKVAALRAVLIEGEQSGVASLLDIETFLADRKHSHAE